MTLREQLLLTMQDTSAGTVLLVHVQPKARRNQLCGLHDGRLKLSVTEPPDKGKATAAVLSLLAAIFGISVSRLEVIRGDISRRKDILLYGITVAAAVDLIAATLDADERNS